MMSSCPSCGTEVKPGSRACHECGASFTAQVPAVQWIAQTILPWVAIGVSMIALIVAVVALFDQGSGGAAQAPTSPAMTSTAPAPAQAVDLANMSPRQAADRLFNRVMTASENGNSEEALRFAPMALQAYDNVGELDNDARYHVALLHLTTDDIKSARGQIDKLRQSAPNHLLGIMLEHQIAVRSGKKDSATRAYKAFLAAYDAEIATGRVEYQEHRGGLERFRTAAQASLAGMK